MGFNPNQPRDKDGKWSSFGAQAQHHLDQAAALGKKGAEYQGRLAAGHAANAAQALVDGKDPDGHLDKLHAAVTALRIKAHKAKQAGDGDAVEHDAAFRHYNDILKGLKAAQKGAGGLPAISLYRHGKGPEVQDLHAEAPPVKDKYLAAGKLQQELEKHGFGEAHTAKMKALNAATFAAAALASSHATHVRYNAEVALAAYQQLHDHIQAGKELPDHLDSLTVKRIQQAVKDAVEHAGVPHEEHLFQTPPKGLDDVDQVIEPAPAAASVGGLSHEGRAWVSSRMEQMAQLHKQTVVNGHTDPDQLNKMFKLASDLRARQLHLQQNGGSKEDIDHTREAAKLAMDFHKAHSGKNPFEISSAASKLVGFHYDHHQNEDGTWAHDGEQPASEPQTAQPASEAQSPVTASPQGSPVQVVAPNIIPYERIGKKVSGATGTNPGGFYKGPDGKEYYVKQYDHPGQAACEHIANRLYEAVGVPVANTSLSVSPEGKLLHVSEIIPGVTQAVANAETGRQLAQGLVVDSVLGNHDVVGHYTQNVVNAPDGTLYRIDNGGSILYKGLEGRKNKSVVQKLTELETFFDPSMSAKYAQSMGAAGYGHWTAIPGVENQLLKTADALRPENVDKMVDPIPGVSDEEKQEIKQALTHRRSELLKKHQEFLDHKAKMAAEAARNQEPKVVPQSHLERMAWADQQPASQKIQKGYQLPPTVKEWHEQLKQVWDPSEMHGYALPSEQELKGTHSAIQQHGLSIGHMTQPDQFMRCLDEGGTFKTIHDTKIGNGGSGGSAIKVRTKVETKLGMWDGQTNNRAPFYCSPLYGITHQPPPEQLTSNNDYGSVLLDLHPHVMDRAAWYPTDTYEQPKQHSTEQGIGYMAAVQHQNKGNLTLQESNVLGGMSMDDVRAVRLLPSSHNSADVIRAKLDRLGLSHLPIYLVDEGHNLISHHSGEDYSKKGGQP